MYYHLKIDQQCAETNRHQPYSIWEKESFKSDSIDAIKEKIKDHYGKIPFRKGNEIYRDVNDISEHIGFHYSYWEFSCDRNLPPNHKYFATDWITIIKHETLTAIDEITQ